MTMNLYPAIDIKFGRVVRLTRGDFDRETLYHDSPVEQARVFASLGCSWLHVVDLDGAAQGQRVNGEVIREIVSELEMNVQLGGGVRCEADVVYWLEAGVARVVLGTLAVRDESLTQQLLQTHGTRIAIGLDSRDGKVAINGWQKQTQTPIEDIASRYTAHPPACFIHTDINRDGMETGINLSSSLSLAKSCGVQVIVSGGVASLDDVRKVLSADEPLLAGLIVGRAYYEGNFDIAAALRLMKGEGV